MKPLLNLDELLNRYWPHLLPGFQKVLEYTTGDESISTIMQGLVNQNMICWVWEGTEGRVIDGFSTTNFKDELEKVLVIHHSWVHPDVQPLSLTAKTHEFLEGYAKELDCSKIKVYSLRDISRWMKHYGFHPTYVEYEKVLC